jgi:cytochrome bd-type quinol oxidase subunit 1
LDEIYNAKKGQMIWEKMAMLWVCLMELNVRLGTPIGFIGVGFD